MAKTVQGNSDNVDSFSFSAKLVKDKNIKILSIKWREVIHTGKDTGQSRRQSMFERGPGCSWASLGF